MKTEWLLCPVCGNKTRDRIREDTVLENFPLYCPKCKQENLIHIKRYMDGLLHIYDYGKGGRITSELFKLPLEARDRLNEQND